MGKTNKIKKRRLEKLACSLIDIYSPSGKEEEVLSFLYRYFCSLKIPVKKQKVDESRYNLVIGDENNRTIPVLCGHLDTAPAFNLDRYESVKKRYVIEGLGAADMKGGCAAIAEAFVCWYENYRKNPPLNLIFVVGEEDTEDGIEEFLKEYRPTWAIVAEPTNLAVCAGHYGYLEVEIATFGYRRHASLANTEHNAIYTMFRAIKKITDFLDKDKKSISYNIRDVHSSDAGFAVPDRCSAWIDVHVPPFEPLEEVAANLRNILEKVFTNPRDSVKFPSFYPGYQISAGFSILGSLKNIYIQKGLKWSVEDFRSHSDANIMKVSGVKPLILGPGQLAKAHSENESISISQLKTASQLYFELLQSISLS
ncbi:MAG: M20/M25/M40 family metallo-hydrolase [Candidatus Omnitrophica bacterium]|nr:M20/M25/M40 family metallo-hydrolase [Candidatus Omnitrophota bacterium]MBD3268809.1 M20/M25/M40 family metallo-hydrolase [Candidatus Omnitrophota bacterium]